MLSQTSVISNVIHFMYISSEIKDGQYIFDITSVANSTRLQVNDLSNHLQTLKVSSISGYYMDSSSFMGSFAHISERLDILM